MMANHPICWSIMNILFRPTNRQATRATADLLRSVAVAVVTSHPPIWEAAAAAKLAGSNWRKWQAAPLASGAHVKSSSRQWKNIALASLCAFTQHWPRFVAASAVANNIEVLMKLTMTMTMVAKIPGCRQRKLANKCEQRRLATWGCCSCCGWRNI